MSLTTATQLNQFAQMNSCKKISNFSTLWFVLNVFFLFFKLNQRDIILIHLNSIQVNVYFASEIPSNNTWFPIFHSQMWISHNYWQKYAHFIWQCRTEIHRIGQYHWVNVLVPTIDTSSNAHLRSSSFRLWAVRYGIRNCSPHFSYISLK